MYKCKKGFALEKCDGDGFSLDNEQINIEEGSNWFIPEDENYRLIGGEVRLEDGDGAWIEICEDTLKEHFEKVYIQGN